MIEYTPEKEKVILVGVELPAAAGSTESEDSLTELGELAVTAGADILGKVRQSRGSIHPATYIGKGKIEELKALIAQSGATGIVCDDELTPAQLRNLSDALDVKILDRTLLILDIFASRATTSEGKIQVELAQLRYSASHLAGSRSYLSRLGGGIGTRGPGEKKLEMDRRLIGRRISILKGRIEEMKRTRQIQRQRRNDTQIPLVAIVGYTNAGKSTLLNRLTDAHVLEEDMLFATLDPTTRKLTLPGGRKVLLTDTVGFIRKLPHHLIDAFRSTLEEAKYADLFLHVVDASNPQRERQMEIVYKTLHDLDALGKPVITLFNKMDLLPEGEQVRLFDTLADHTLKGSVKGPGSGRFLSEVKDLLEEVLDPRPRS